VGAPVWESPPLLVCHTPRDCCKPGTALSKASRLSAVRTRRHRGEAVRRSREPRLPLGVRRPRRRGVLPAVTDSSKVLGVFYRECCTPGTVAMAENRRDGTAMIGELFGEGRRLTHQTRDTLTSRVVQTIEVIGFAGFFRGSLVLRSRHHPGVDCLVRLSSLTS
jgi:hypothetical protein